MTRWYWRVALSRKPTDDEAAELLNTSKSAVKRLRVQMGDEKFNEKVEQAKQEKRERRKRITDERDSELHNAKNEQLRRQGLER